MPDRVLEICISMQGMRNVIDKYNENLPKLQVGDTFNFSHNMVDGSRLCLSYYIDKEKG